MAGVAAVGTGVGTEGTAETPLVAPPPPPAPGSEDVDLPPTDTEPQSDPVGRFKWIIPVLIAAVAAAVIALFALGILDGTDNTTAAPATTLPPTPTTVAPTTVPPSPPATAAPATTSTTTTTTIPEPSSFEAVGTAIPVSSLSLTANGIGPIAFGDASSDAVGRLVASLGEPEETGVAGEELGLCADDDGRFVRWAGLTVAVAGTFADGVFSGYRYEDEEVPRMHLDLATPSGLRVGDPVSTLNQIYSSYQIDYLSSEGTNIFRLSDADGLLLWGPVSSIEDSGRVEGIYAPDACST